MDDESEYVQKVAAYRQMQQHKKNFQNESEEDDSEEMDTEEFGKRFMQSVKPTNSMSTIQRNFYPKDGTLDEITVDYTLDKIIAEA